MHRLGDLTRQQVRALGFIGRFIAEHGYGPTMTEICIGTGLSPKSRAVMHWRVQRLRRLKYLVTQPRARQSIVLAPKGVAWLKSMGCPVGAPCGVASAPSIPSAPVRPALPGLTQTGQGARAGTNSKRGAL